MNKVDALLLVLLLGSSLLLVRTAYESRQTFAALDQARAELGRLDAEHKRLTAEAQAQGTHLRVERTARERLQMRTATPAVTSYVVDPAAASASAAAAADAGGAAPPTPAPEPAAASAPAAATEPPR